MQAKKVTRPAEPIASEGARVCIVSDTSGAVYVTVGEMLTSGSVGPIYQVKRYLLLVPEREAGNQWAPRRTVLDTHVAIAPESTRKAG